MLTTASHSSVLYQPHPTREGEGEIYAVAYTVYKIGEYFYTYLYFNIFLFTVQQVTYDKLKRLLPPSKLIC
jgi:hypothetical protein